MKNTIVLIFSFVGFWTISAFSQNKTIPQITLSNYIKYADTSYTDLPGNGFLLDIGDEILAVTCKHVFWENHSRGLKTIQFNGTLKEWKMIVLNDPSQYVILGELINSNSNEAIGERNTDKDYLVFKIKENHSKITPLKLCPTHIKSADTLYQVGWSYKTKKTSPQIHTVIAQDYAGSSLYVNNLIQENTAGLSGSPMINKNNELVGIVSSWKYDLPAQKWFEATCSTDYLWEVLYSYWLVKNKKEKSILSFQKYIDQYKVLNGKQIEASSNLVTSLFFPEWLASKGYQYGSIEYFNEWATILEQTYGIVVKADNYRKSLLIFESWMYQYVAGNMEIKNLEQILEEAKVSIPGFIDFCENAQVLSEMGEYDKAIALLLYADEKIQHMGQLYAFLGDVYLAKGEKSLAKDAYSKCLQTYPNYPQALDGMEKIKKI